MKAEEIIADFINYNVNSLNNLKTASPELSKAFGSVLGELAKKYMGVQITTPASQTPANSGYRVDYENLTKNNLSEFFDNFVFENVSISEEEEYLKKWGFGVKFENLSSSKVYCTNSLLGLKYLLILSNEKILSLFYLDDVHHRTTSSLNYVLTTRESDSETWNYEEYPLNVWAKTYDRELYNRIVENQNKSVASGTQTGLRRDFANLNRLNVSEFFESFNSNISYSEREDILKNKDAISVRFDNTQTANVYLANGVSDLQNLLRLAREGELLNVSYYADDEIKQSNLELVSKKKSSNSSQWNTGNSDLVGWAEDYDKDFLDKLNKKINASLSTIPQPPQKKPLTIEDIKSIFLLQDWNSFSAKEKMTKAEIYNFILIPSEGELGGKAIFINEYNTLVEVLKAFVYLFCEIKFWGYNQDFHTTEIQPDKSSVGARWNFAKETLIEFAKRKDDMFFQKINSLPNTSQSTTTPQSTTQPSTTPTPSSGYSETYPPGLPIEENIGNRPSPTQSAASWGYENSYAKGNDGNWYKITETISGMKRWVKSALPALAPGSQSTTTATPTPSPIKSYRDLIGETLVNPTGQTYIVNELRKDNRKNKLFILRGTNGGFIEFILDEDEVKQLFNGKKVGGMSIVKPTTTATSSSQTAVDEKDYEAMDKSGLLVVIEEMKEARSFFEASDPEYQELTYEIENAQDVLDKK